MTDDCVLITEDKPPPKKVEVNTNDILVAFASNLGCLSPSQLKFVGKAIARQSPERVSEVVEAISIKSEKQAEEGSSAAPSGRNSPRPL